MPTLVTAAIHLTSSLAPQTGRSPRLDPAQPQGLLGLVGDRLRRAGPLDCPLPLEDRHRQVVVPFTTA